ncbi:MAG: hypothetical protein ACI4LX_10370 [Treponema sp.]
MKKTNKKRNFIIPVILLFLFFILIGKCTSYNNEEEKKSEEASKQNIENIEDKMTFSELWEYKKANIPDFKEYEHLKSYSFDELCRFYRMLEIEYFNVLGSIDTRVDRTPEVLAEKNQISKYVFLETKSYFRKFYDYCDEFNKEYFKRNSDLLINPNYNGSITSTAYIGNFTFDCYFKLGKVSKEKLETLINEKIDWLKNNLPDFYDGLRILRISYIDEITDVEKTYDYSYIYRKKDNQLKQMKYGNGTYGKELPEKEKHWWMKSWNNMEKLNQIY